MKGESMTEEFYDWLDQCPVQWVRLSEESLHSEYATYKFYADDEEVDEDTLPERKY